MNPITAQIDRHAQALSLLSERQKVLASNIANADTPGFQARDFDFSQALEQARGNPSSSMSSTIAKPTAPLAHDPGPNTPTVNLMWRTAGQPTPDGNTVDLDRERANFSDNALRYEATLRFINNDVKTILSAITGQ